MKVIQLRHSKNDRAEVDVGNVPTGGESVSLQTEANGENVDGNLSTSNDCTFYTPLEDNSHCPSNNCSDVGNVPTGGESVTSQTDLSSSNDFTFYTAVEDLYQCPSSNCSDVGNVPKGGESVTSQTEACGKNVGENLSSSDDCTFYTALEDCPASNRLNETVSSDSTSSSESDANRASDVCSASSRLEQVTERLRKAIETFRKNKSDKNFDAVKNCIFLIEDSLEDE